MKTYTVSIIGKDGEAHLVEVEAPAWLSGITQIEGRLVLNILSENEIAAAVSADAGSFAVKSGA
jgi:hypothetical protein